MGSVTYAVQSPKLRSTKDTSHEVLSVEGGESRCGQMWTVVNLGEDRYNFLQVGKFSKSEVWGERNRS